MRWKTAQACVRGTSHQRSGLPNQDAVQCSVTPGANGSLAVAVVADGHGGARHFRSQVGAALAVSLSTGILKSFLQTHEASGAPVDAPQVEELERKMVSDWVASVASDLQHNPFTPAELGSLENAEGAEAKSAVEEFPQLAYGTTLLAVAATSIWILYLQLGDGEILTVGADGRTTRPLPPDARLVGNQTTSLCRPEAWKDFRASWSTEAPLPPMVLLSTDGYPNSFRSDQDFLKIGQDYLEIAREQGISALAEELPSILKEATQQGSGDDITLAIVYDDCPLSADNAGRAPVRPALSAASKSALIEQLKARHSSQQRRLDELASRVEQTQMDNRRLRYLILLLFLAVTAIPLVTFRDQIFFSQGRTASSGPIVGHRNEKPVTVLPGQASPTPNPPEPRSEWTLRINHGGAVDLRKGSRISARLIHPKSKDRTYAEVAEQSGKFILINDSEDTWMVTAVGGGKRAQKIGRGGSLDLGGAPVDIAFSAEVSGHLALALPAQPHGARP